MMAQIRGYLLGLAAAALLCALVRALLPKGQMRRIGTVFCGVFLALCALQGARGLDLSEFAAQLSRERMDAEQTISGVEVRNRELLAAIIKDKLEAYILDKAAQMGLELTVSVTVQSDGAYPYPSHVRLCGTATAQQRAALGRYIEENLAVLQEEQEWSSE